MLIWGMPVMTFFFLVVLRVLIVLLGLYTWIADIYEGKKYDEKYKKFGITNWYRTW